jgi:hypothetical protein
LNGKFAFPLIAIFFPGRAAQKKMLAGFQRISKSKILGFSWLNGKFAFPLIAIFPPAQKKFSWGSDFPEKKKILGLFVVEWKICISIDCDFSRAALPKNISGNFVSCGK